MDILGFPIAFVSLSFACILGTAYTERRDFMCSTEGILGINIGGIQDYFTPLFNALIVIRKIIILVIFILKWCRIGNSME